MLSATHAKVRRLFVEETDNTEYELRVLRIVIQRLVCGREKVHMYACFVRSINQWSFARIKYIQQE